MLMGGVAKKTFGTDAPLLTFHAAQNAELDIDILNGGEKNKK
jgi:hypothetical protein